MGRFEGRYLSGRPSDRRYDSAGAAEFFRCFFESGVVALEDNLCVEAVDAQSACIHPGKALLDGYLVKIVATEEEPYLIPVPEGEKWGRVVLRAEKSGPGLYIKEGTAEEPPTLERGGGIYEISLASICSKQGVMTVVDERADQTLCGVCGLLTNKISFSGLVDLVYPVGSYYLTHSDRSPAELFGGTWERIAGRFLFGCAESEAIGGTGGSKTASYTLGSGYAQTDVTSAVPFVWSFKRFSNTDEYTGTIDVTGGTNSKVVSASSIRHRGISLGGSTDEGNNMPPYINVAIWRRTA